MKLYRYGMRLRGFSIGCQPREGLIECEKSSEYHDELIYDRKLTEEEIEEYELEYIEEWGNE